MTPRRRFPSPGAILILVVLAVLVFERIWRLLR